VQATKLLALSLAIILSPRVAMTDVVGHVGHSRATTIASATATVEPGHDAGQAGTKTASTKPAGHESGAARARSSAPKIKGRWGSPRRLTALRRSPSKALANLSLQCPRCPLAWLWSRSCSNCSGASGLANR
jgi:hypothetical protein